VLGSVAVPTTFMAARSTLTIKAGCATPATTVLERAK
jgi:hypothetical protein